MATFSKASYSASSYAAFRPEYPESLYKTILSYHSGARAVLLDLGTGHGLVSRSLAPHFKEVIATDPSSVMLEQARSQTSAAEHPNLTFRQASAESLAFLKDGSVDVVVAGQAAHWFDFPRFWPEMARVVRQGGTIGLWGYNVQVLPEYPHATSILNHYAYDEDPDLLGGYWSQPGRSIVEGYYQAIQPPQDEWKGVTRLDYKPHREGGPPAEGDRMLSKRLSVRDLKEYIGTWSAYHAWREAHPDAKSGKDLESGTERDVLDILFNKMISAEDEWNRKGDAVWDLEVSIEWGSSILIASRK